MVNIVFHNVAAATDDDYGEIESQEDLLNDPVYEVKPEFSQSFFGGWFPKNPTETTFSKKLIKSFGAVTKIKRRGKHNSEKVEKVLREIAKEKPRRFSSKQLTKFTQNFSDPIGRGGFGSVYRGKIPNQTQVAVKVLTDISYEEEHFIVEVSILGRTYHRNLIKLLGFCFEKKMKALVYEYMEKGTLARFLFHDGHRTDWGKLHSIMLGVARGLAYLHECCDLVIMHYDIKPDNILLDSNFCPKIADFGLSQLYDRGKPNATPISIRGTRGYVAPELLMSPTAASTYKCDVFSFGMMLFEIVGKRRNVCYQDQYLEWLPQKVWDNFKKGKLEEFIIELGIDAKDRKQAKKVFMVALWCIQHKSQDRPYMSYVVKILEGEIETMEPPCPFDSMAFSNEDSQVSITVDSDLTIVKEIGERDSEDFSPVADYDIGIFTPSMEKFEIVERDSEDFSPVADCDIGIFTPSMEKFEIDMVSASQRFVQYMPEDRPSVSPVVKIVEGEIETTKPPYPFQFMTFTNEASQVRITINLDLTLVKEIIGRDNKDFSPVVDYDVASFTPSMEKFEMDMASSSKSYQW